MALTSGTQLGSYEIVAPLGAGGMGEVYRARDTRLGRDVALKTLPERLTHDPERLARFRREAQVLASLNHPHIGSIYGLEEVDGQRFLVLELIEGETLAARLQRGPLPASEAISIAREIAEALQSAHEKGVVHRDLKPANVALTEHDRVKVLDFGLAKITEPAAGSDTNVLDSPTITSPSMLTGLGVILGTAAYMSPEQARGRTADKRSDVWAFGCVLYEMLTGTRPFKGEEVTDTLAAVLKTDPDWNALPSSVPPSVRTLLEGCLEKKHQDRISDMSTVLFVLRRPISLIAPPTAVTARGTRRWATWLFLAIAGAALGALATVALRPPSQVAAAPVVRFKIPIVGVQPTLSRRALAVSPDGSRVAYSADGKLYLRFLNEMESRLIPGGDPAVLPAFSPDGQSLVFWTEGTLKRIPVNGGTPVTLCSTSPAPFGIQWSDQGIVFVEPARGVMKVSANGGQPALIAAVPPAEGLLQGPQLLPDGDGLLFSIAKPAMSVSNFWDKADVVVHSIKTQKRTTVINGGSDARYLPTGHIVYMVEGTLMAVPFDLAARRITSGPVPVVEGIRRAAPMAGNGAQYDLSASGTLVYMAGPSRSGQEDVFVYERQGLMTPLKLPAGAYAHPRASPDGTRIAVETTDSKNATIAVYSLSGTSSLRRLTFGGNNRFPIWSGDGKRIVFQSDRENDLGIFWQPADGGAVERLTRAEPGTSHVPESWAPEGDAFLYTVTKGTESTLWLFSLKDRQSTRFGNVTSAAFPTDATFSPDGKWVAYQSGDGSTGEATLYVQPFPANGKQYEIGRGGRPRWSPDGRELFFVPGPSQFAAVSISTEPEFGFSAQVPVPRHFGLAPPANARPYDILPDKRFVSVDAANVLADPQAPQIQVVLNWFEELRQKVPVGK